MASASSGARRHRSGVIEVRPILEQFVSLRQIPEVQDLTILFEKGEIADCRGAVEDRDENKDQLRPVGSCLFGDLPDVEMVFAAAYSVQRARDEGLPVRPALLRKERRARNRMHHIDRFPELVRKVRRVIGALARVGLRIELFWQAEQGRKQLRPEQLRLAGRQISKVVEIVVKERRRREDNRVRGGDVFEGEMAEGMGLVIDSDNDHFRRLRFEKLVNDRPLDVLPRAANRQVGDADAFSMLREPVFDCVGAEAELSVRRAEDGDVDRLWIETNPLVVPYQHAVHVARLQLPSLVGVLGKKADHGAENEGDGERRQNRRAEPADGRFSLRRGCCALQNARSGGPIRARRGGGVWRGHAVNALVSNSSISNRPGSLARRCRAAGETHRPPAGNGSRHPRRSRR